MTHGKKQWLSIFVSILIAILCIATSPVLSAEKPPIKIGLLLPYTGTMPFQTKGVTDAVELYFSELGYKAGGRSIQIIKEDDEQNPTVGLTKVRRLVEQQKVNFIVGPVSSAVGLAIQDYVRKQNVILLNPVANTRELTGPDKAAENIFRTVETSDQCNYPMGKWVIKNTPHRNMVITGSDFAGGHHNVEAFKAGFEDAGGKIVKEVFPKLGTMDFASFFGLIDAKGVDAVYAMYVGTDSVRFVQQYSEFGLRKTNSPLRIRDDCRRSLSDRRWRCSDRSHNQQSLPSQPGYAQKPKLCQGIQRKIWSSSLSV